MMTMPMRMLLLAIAGWVNEEQRAKIAFLEEQVRVYQEVHGRRPRFNNDQRRRLAAKGKRLGPACASRARHDRDARHNPAMEP
jgi:hypothetical protein